jgi:hypothetical protein
MNHVGERVLLAAHEPVVDDIKKKADEIIQTEYRHDKRKISLLRTVLSVLHGLRSFLLTAMEGAKIVTMTTLLSILAINLADIAIPSLGALSLLKVLLPIGASVVGLGFAGIVLSIAALFALGWVGKRIIRYIVKSGWFSNNELDRGLVRHHKSKPKKP